MNANKEKRLGIRVGMTQVARAQLKRAMGRNAWVDMESVLCELHLYLSCAERAGRALDQNGQELRYDDRLMVIVKKRDGIWQVVKAWRLEGERACVPVLAWRRMWRGACEVLVRVLFGWRYPMCVHATISP